MVFFLAFLCSSLLVLAVCLIIRSIVKSIEERKYHELEEAALKVLGFSDFGEISYYDIDVTVKSRRALESYDDIRYFKENHAELARAKTRLRQKLEKAKKLLAFLEDNEFKENAHYKRLESTIHEALKNAYAYRILVRYVSYAGNYLDNKTISVSQRRIEEFYKTPSLLMSKTEYNRYLKERQQEALEKKRHKYYEMISAIIDFANENREKLIIKGSKDTLDGLISQLFDRTVGVIGKIKTSDSEEWDIVGSLVEHVKKEVEKVIGLNRKILEYYDSERFEKVRASCETLMSSQREFNEYIIGKIQSISDCFGKRAIRDETVIRDEYEYVRPYKKTISPFVAEVSAAVFASAENNPMGYLVKSFYPDKARYPEHIRKLQKLVEELETLREARLIIENYKAEYQHCLSDVPSFVMKHDASGFYSRLGFAVIDESTLTVEYKFTYTSGGGKAQRSFSIPMTEETIIKLIQLLESKLTMGAFAKEQRILMTKKLRDFIKGRDNFTCCSCGNSTHREPNLLLEIDHIIPVSKGGVTEENNLQTLCWKCNRAKSNKLIS